MECSRLLILSFVLNVAYCLEMLDEGKKMDVEIEHNVTGILGEEVTLSCQYLGQNEIINAQWKRSNSKEKTKRLAGYSSKRPFSRDIDFSSPASSTNLTVKMKVSSLEAEGQYSCVFTSKEEEINGTMLLVVLARPDIQTWASDETVNNTHYQSITCAAVHGRPIAQISWEINGLPPTVGSFTVDMTNTSHSNGTATVSSVLRFPTLVQEQDRVICVVQHPTLPHPTRITVRVQTYVSPNVTIEKEQVRWEEREFWRVICRASGGRPVTAISLALPADKKPLSRIQREDYTDSDVQIYKYVLRAELYEGQNISCVFDHPTFPHPELRTIRLPEYYLSAVWLKKQTNNTCRQSEVVDYVELEEGQLNTTIHFEVIGEVPRYIFNCTKQTQVLPEGVEMNGTALTVPGPVELRHAGLYVCQASYHRHKASIQLNITVKPQVKQPVYIPPRIRVDIQEGAGDRQIECLAADAVPAANVSWLLPEGVSVFSWSNFTFHNGSHSVRGVVVLPACSPRELSLQCLIDHPAFEKPQSREIKLRLCALPNITVNHKSEWGGGTVYTVVQCLVDSTNTAALISWALDDGNSTTSHLGEVEEHVVVHVNGFVTIRSLLRFPSTKYSGQNVTCVVQHQSLHRPERRQVHVPLPAPVMLSVAVRRQKDSPLWLALCEYRGEVVWGNLSWVLPQNTTGKITLQSEYEGPTLHTKLTYEFPLAQHEGRNLTCVSQHENRQLRNTTTVPRYYISSIRVLNKTTPLYGPPGSHHIVHRLSLQEHLRNQRILLKVYGSMPAYYLCCERSDGEFAQMEGLALVFQSEVKKHEEGLYVCHASFYHHKATVFIQVEVTNEEQQLLTLGMVCLSLVSAIILIVVIPLCVCLRKIGNQSKKRESLAMLTSLMQEPCSPRPMKAALLEKEIQDNAHLVSYSIVIDVKSTV